MAETPVVMPKMSMTMTEGEVVEILVSVGDQVSKGQVVAVVGTDKTDMEVESDHEGEVTEISAGPGDVIEVGAPLFVLRTEGEDLLAGMFGDAAQPAAADAAAEPVETQAMAAPPAQAPSSDSPVLAMPGARKLAREQGIDLATITPAAGSVGPAAALLVGLSGGIVCYFCTTYLKQKMRIDDSLDVFPVHGVGGIVGTLLAGVLVSDNLGIFSGNGLAEGMTIGSQLSVQAIGIVIVGLFTFVVTFGLLKLVSALTGGIRVSAEEEQIGLDIVDHDEKGYSM